MAAHRRSVVVPTEIDDLTVDRLLAIGAENGLDAVGVTTAAPLERALAALTDRVDRRIDGGLPFTYRNPIRSTTPEMAVAGARSVVVGARTYLCDEPVRPDGILGRVARYSWIDHYAPLRAGLRAVAAELKRLGWRATVFADDNSVVDREVAWRAGIGWYGKNANLLLPRAGSWYVLGCLITNAEIPPAPAPVPDGCGSCRKCFDGCPTEAIIESGVIDANRCLAWLLQRPGVFPAEFRRALGDRLYGCDDCQEVCPPNIRFSRRRAERAQPHDAWANILDLLESDDGSILDQFGRWYLHQREPRWLRRNALIILGNVASADDARTRRVLGRYVGDPDAMLRAHAVWSLRTLGLDHMIPDGDTDPMVVVERERELTEHR